jgi:hypothetical protein
MKRIDWKRLAILVSCCGVLSSVFTGCSGDSDADFEEELGTAVSELSSGCRDPDVVPSKKYSGGVTPQYTSAQTYDDCSKAGVIEVKKYSSEYAVGGYTVVRWADALPTDPDECRKMYLTAEVYVKDGSSWSLVKTKSAHGDYLRDDKPSDVVLPPQQPARPVTGTYQKWTVGSVDLGSFGTSGVLTAAQLSCTAPAVYFYGAELEAGKTYRIAASARRSSSSSTLRKFSIASVEGTCGQDSLYCCTSGDQCDASLTCDGKLCKPCGDTNQLCCNGSSCEDAKDSCQGGSCKPCGEKDLGCCSGDRCNDPSNFTCQKGVCKPCGGSGQDCCEQGNSCDDPTSFSCQSGKCKACGGSGEQCCDGQQCRGSGLECVSGSCKATPPACTATSCQLPMICRAALPGSTPVCMDGGGPCNAPGEACCGVGGSGGCTNELFKVSCNSSSGKCEPYDCSQAGDPCCVDHSGPTPKPSCTNGRTCNLRGRCE